VGLDEETMDLLKRAVLALEGIAIHQKRVAGHLDEQQRESAGFRAAVDSLINASVDGEVPGPIDSPADQPDTSGTESVEEPPRIINEKAWYIEINDPDQPVMVRLTDGTTRRATDREKRILK
jgi:hypothetical protein